MKGVILAGGNGTRLHPLTLVTNKHLLPVYNKPVIYYAIEKMVSAGIEKIMIVTSPHHVDNFVKLLGSGQNFPSPMGKRQVQIVYGIQNKPAGLAQGLWIARDYVGDDNCLFYLGDNIFEDDITAHVKNFKSGATIFLKEVDEPWHYGVATTSDGKVVKIDEKPRRPKSNYAVTGLYIYDNSVFGRIPRKKSSRGEYEITDVNNAYIADGKMRSVILKKRWFDIGNIEKLLEASNYFRNRKTT